MSLLVLISGVGMQLACGKETELSEQSRTLQVIVDSEPPEAEVLLESTPVGSTPVALRIDPVKDGVVTLQKPGFVSQSVRVPRTGEDVFVYLRPESFPTDPVVEPQMLLRELLRFQSIGDRPELQLHAAGAPNPKVLSIDVPLTFQARSKQAGYGIFFSIASDGTVVCVYPNLLRPFLEMPQNETMSLPLEEDRDRGLELVTSPPAGTDVVFLMTTPSKPSAPPPGQSSGWLTVYPFETGGGVTSAQRFLQWIAHLRRSEPSVTRLVFAVYHIKG